MTSERPSSHNALPPVFSIGLTGGIGCGKTTVANLFADMGAAIIDTDLIAHSLTKPDGIAIDAIRSAFGAPFLTAEGAMDRVAMRRLVFADPAARSTLEAILHPLIRQETTRAVTTTPGLYPIFVVPLLVETPQWKEKVSRILVIDCPEEMQIARVMSRSNITREEVLAIMAAQTSRPNRVAHADDVIDNQSNTTALRPQVERLHAFYQTLMH